MATAELSMPCSLNYSTGSDWEGAVLAYTMEPFQYAYLPVDSGKIRKPTEWRKAGIESASSIVAVC